jgi:hypothetical protein
MVVEEADETVFWLELLVDGEIMPERRLASLMQEGNELVAMFGASLRTAKLNRGRR